MLTQKDITKAIMIKAALRLRFPDLSQVTGLSDRVLRLILTEGHTTVSATTEGRLKEFKIYSNNTKSPQDAIWSA